jgi:predicted ATPase
MDLPRSRLGSTMVFDDEHIGLWERGNGTTTENLTDGRPVTIFVRKPALREAQAAIGKTGEALSTLEDAIAVGEATEERWYVAELLRNKGALYQTTGTNNGVAEECFRQAVSTAREQGSQCFELRAATSLARLWRDQGKRHEARDLLAPVYGWFTEGFDTLDLKEAKTLLDELAS